MILRAVSQRICRNSISCPNNLRTPVLLLYRYLKSVCLVQGKYHPEEALLVITFYISTHTGGGVVQYMLLGCRCLNIRLRNWSRQTAVVGFQCVH
jgi:hypothetical protein